VRTTITLEPETAALVEKTMKQRNLSFKQVVNEAILRGLTTSAPPKPFRTKTRSMGVALVNLDKATQLAAELEDEEIIRKMSLGK
jgi:hypothetical protein